MKLNRLFLLIWICASFSGCSILSTLSPTLGEFMVEAEENQQAFTDAQFLQQYLEDGWEFFLYDDSKLVLIKHTESGMLVKDIFQVLD